MLPSNRPPSVKVGRAVPCAPASTPPGPALPIRPLWVSCVGEKGGAEVYLLNFLRNHDPARVRPGVVLLRPGPLERELLDDGFDVFVLDRHRMRNLPAVGRAILQTRRIARDHGFHLVHGNCFRSHPYAGLAARFAGVPSVWSVHTAEKPALSASLIARIPVSSVTANCPRTADWFAARRLPVNLIWPPVDLARLEQRIPRSDLATRYGIPASARWIGMAGRLQRYKGHDFLLRALASLPPSLADVQALLIGGALFDMEQDYLAELRRRAAELGVAERVHFTGFVPDSDLYGFIASCDLVVHPALDEDFGLIVAEAQALARPVVAFASVGPSSIVEDGVTGRLTPIGDAPAFTGAIAALLESSSEERDRFGAAGRQRVERLFAAPVAARRLERVYHACLGGPPLVLDSLRQPLLPPST